METGETVRIVEGANRGKEGVVFLPLRMGAEVIIDGKRHWFHRAEFETVVTV